jgi:hypothetical protein
MDEILESGEIDIASCCLLLGLPTSKFVFLCVLYFEVIYTLKMKRTGSFEALTTTRLCGVIRILVKCRKF